jgi:hypothetical protein
MGIILTGLSVLREQDGALLEATMILMLDGVWWHYHRRIFESIFPVCRSRYFVRIQYVE